MGLDSSFPYLLPEGKLAITGRGVKSYVGSTYSSAWLNLNRYDHEPSLDNQGKLSRLDSLLIQELQLIIPDIVIFFTGPKYDNRVVQLLQGTQFLKGTEQIKIINEELFQIMSPVLNSLILCTYHPNYLRLRGLEEKVISAICRIAGA